MSYFYKYNYKTLRLEAIAGSLQKVDVVAVVVHRENSFGDSLFN